MKFTPANIAFLVLSLVVYLEGHGQANNEKPWKRFRKTEIVTGLNFQTSDYKDSRETRRYFELGVARSVHNGSRHGPASFGTYLSEEVYFGNNGQKNIYGTKWGVYTHYLFDVGMSMVYYTDFDRGNLKLRPELGIGLGALRIVGGYNIPTFGNRQFEAMRKSNGQLTIQLMVPVKKKEIPEHKNLFKDLFQKI